MSSIRTTKPLVSPKPLSTTINSNSTASKTGIEPKLTRKPIRPLKSTKSLEAPPPTAIPLTTSGVLGPEGIKDLRTAFRLLDKNSDGQVSISEFQGMLKNFGITVPEIHVIRVVERSSSTGKLGWTEEDFLNWISPFLENDDNPDQDLLAAFQVFDKDRNGYITKDELKKAMEIIGEDVSDSDLNEMLAIADVDNDGRIDYGEFARLLG